MSSVTPNSGRRFTRSRSALVFPGQGSQHERMREVVEAERPDLLEIACRVVGTDPFDRLSEGTEFVQPAIFCSTLAWWERLGRPRAEVLAGHSLGELSALAVAGSINAADALRVVALRGRLTQRAAERQGDGGMLAVLGAPAGGAAQLAKRCGVALATENSPTQNVLSGPGEALDAATTTVKAEGLRCVRLPVSGAFHSPAMAPAAPAFRAALAEIRVRTPDVPTYSGVTAQPFGDVRELLVRGLTEGIRWHATFEAAYAAGVRKVVEVGPGSVLTGLIRRSHPDVEASSAEATARDRLEASA